MDKRGSILFGGDIVLWIFRIVVLVTMAVILAVFAGLALRTTVDIRNAETKLMINSIIYSPNGIILTQNGRAYPGVIDIQKFTLNDMDLAFHVVFDPLPEKQFWAYNLTLFNASMKPITSVIGNEDWYHRWCVLAGTGLPGTGGAIRLVETYYVEIRHPDKSEMGFLRVDITRPNT